MKLIKNILIIIYLFIVVFVTFCLLSYNDKGITIINNKAFITDRNDIIKNGELVIVDTSFLDIKKGDYIYYYDVVDGDNIVNGGYVKFVNDSNKNDIAYSTEDGYSISMNNVIGNKEHSFSYAVIGGILSFLESRWGYLIVIVFPILLAFIYEVYMIIKEIGRK